MKLTLGSAPDNDIIIDDASVNAHQAEIEVINNELLLIKDLNLSGSIKINDKPIVTARLKPQQNIIIGKFAPDTQSFFNDVISAYKSKKTDFSEEYKELMEVFKVYQKKKDLINKQPLTPIFIRLVVTAIIMIGIYFFARGIDAEIRILLISGGGAISMVMGSLFTSYNSKRNEKMDLLLLEYENILVCPKCGYKMIKNNYTYWQGKDNCINDKCNAVYKS